MGTSFISLFILMILCSVSFGNDTLSTEESTLAPEVAAITMEIATPEIVKEPSGSQPVVETDCIDTIRLTEEATPPAIERAPATDSINLELPVVLDVVIDTGDSLEVVAEKLQETPTTNTLFLVPKLTLAERLAAIDAQKQFEDTLEMPQPTSPVPEELYVEPIDPETLVAENPFHTEVDPNEVIDLTVIKPVDTTRSELDSLNWDWEEE